MRGQNHLTCWRDSSNSNTFSRLLQSCRVKQRLDILLHQLVKATPQPQGEFSAATIQTFNDPEYLPKCTFQSVNVKYSEPKIKEIEQEVINRSQVLNRNKYSFVNYKLGNAILLHGL
jgi:hypothetical protein